MNKRLLAALEGLFYVTGEDGLTVEQVAVAFEIDQEEAFDYILTLKQEYDHNSRGITLINTANIYKMTTSNSVMDYYRKIYADLNRSRLSNASMEVLSIIAYKQPITRAEIENIRGTNSDNIVRRLLAMSLIKELGRLDVPGRPIIYGTTNDFLDYFKLVSLDELPELLEDIDLSDEDETALFDRE
jgi:segregation and condensation protein B